MGVVSLLGKHTDYKKEFEKSDAHKVMNGQTRIDGDKVRERLVLKYAIELYANRERNALSLAWARKILFMHKTLPLIRYKLY